MCGIIDIKYLYGVGAIKIDQYVNMEIELEEWDPAVEYDRLGINDLSSEILGIKIPKAVIPVRPGRNLSTIIEVAAKNYRQKLLGYNALDLYNRRFNNLVEQ